MNQFSGKTYFYTLASSDPRRLRGHPEVGLWPDLGRRAVHCGDAAARQEVGKVLGEDMEQGKDFSAEIRFIDLHTGCHIKFGKKPPVDIDLKFAF